MLEFVPIASSSAGCSYIVRAPGAPAILIDAGIRFAVIQQALGYKTSELAGCLVSHAHGDHTMAVKDLLTAGIDVYASEGTWKSYKSGAYYGHHRAYCLTAKEEEKIGPWTVMPFEAVHDAEETLGFLIAGFGDKLLYLTDTAYSKYKFPGCTILAVECNWGEEQMRESSREGRVGAERFRRTAGNHMSLERLLRMLAANDLSKVREIHLLHLSSENSSEEEFKTAIARATGVPTYIAAKQGTPC